MLQLQGPKNIFWLLTEDNAGALTVFGKYAIFFTKNTTQSQGYEIVLFDFTIIMYCLLNILKIRNIVSETYGTYNRKLIVHRI